MNVTSVLSKGYLEPARRESNAAGESSSASLAAQERQILAQERALKTASGSAQVSTAYRYTVGPDGRRYITGAEVTIRGGEEDVDRVSGGVKRAVLNPAPGKTGPEDKTEETSEDKTEKAAGGKGSEGTAKAEEDAGEDSEGKAVRELKQIEREVISHEAAHQTAGGRFAGAVSYTYTQGPDGHAYITGGEVPIHVPPSSDPEQTARDMEQVQRAALAPASPSGQDRAVAAQAAAAAAQARQEIAASRARAGTESQTQNKSDAEPGVFKTGAASVQVDLLRDTLRNRVQPGSGSGQTPQAPDWRAAYARAASPLGLWALGRGFETLAPGESLASKEREPAFPFEIAA
jgi:hypothetical protein